MPPSPMGSSRVSRQPLTKGRSSVATLPAKGIKKKEEKVAPRAISPVPSFDRFKNVVMS